MLSARILKSGHAINASQHQIRYQIPNLNKDSLGEEPLGQTGGPGLQPIVGCLPSPDLEVRPPGLRLPVGEVGHGDDGVVGLEVVQGVPYDLGRERFKSGNFMGSGWILLR